MSKRAGQHRHAGRHPRRGRSRRRAHDVPAAGHRLAADVRPRRRHVAVDGEPRLLRAVRARAGRRRSRGAPRRPASSARPLESVDLSPLDARARRPSCCARSRCIPTSSPTRPRRARRRRSRTWVRDFARAFHGFYRDCRVITDDAELTQARLWLAEACRIGLANALGAARRERARRDGPPRRRRRRGRSRREHEHDAPFDLTLLPASARVGGRRQPRRSAASTSPGSAAEFGTPLYVYDEGELRDRCREYRDELRRGRRVREQGVPLHRDGAARRRGGPRPRRRDRRRAARRAARRLPGRAHRVPRQQQVDRRAARRARRRRRPDRRRLVRRARPARRARRRRPPTPVACWSA